MSANRDRLTRVATAARPLLDRLVFVGGAVVELYFTDPASGRVRPTRDADAVVEAGTYASYGRIAESLRALGFRQSAERNDPVYRWRIGEDVLDVMPIDPDVLGFTNPWYAPGMKRAIELPLSGALDIRVFSPPYFLACKLAAHADRGREDPILSRDLEDIVALLANRPELVDEVLTDTDEVRRYIGQQLQEALGGSEASPILQAHLPEVVQVPGLREAVERRVQRLLQF